ncbi:MAG: hypothetical protein WAV41_05895 [Microgenomates group bacterium]
MAKNKNRKSTIVTEITLGGKKIKIGKDAVKSTKGGSFEELVKGLKKLAKKNIFEYT